MATAPLNRTISVAPSNDSFTSPTESNTLNKTISYVPTSGKIQLLLFSAYA